MIPATGNLLVATGNAPWNGSTNWGDSVLVLSPDASRLVGHWTPDNQAELNASDLDLGSTAPALLSGGYFVQGGKDGKLRLISMHSLKLVQTVSTPGLDRPLLGARGLAGHVGLRLRQRRHRTPGGSAAAACTRRGRTEPAATVR